MPPRPEPVAPADDAARIEARALLAGAHFASLSFADEETGSPAISRIAIGLDAAGCPVTLISALAHHHAALRLNPQVAFMVGEPGPKGDPLTHPRLMVQALARFVGNDTPDRVSLRSVWLRDHPKAKLYIDFADFCFVRLHPSKAFLNGGFGRAIRLDAADLLPGT